MALWVWACLCVCLLGCGTEGEHDAAQREANVNAGKGRPPLMLSVCFEGKPCPEGQAMLFDDWMALDRLLHPDDYNALGEYHGPNP